MRRRCGEWKCSRVGYFQKAAQAGEGELVAGAECVDDGERFMGKRPGADAEEVLGDRRAPLGEAAGRERRPAGLERFVEHVAVGEMLDEEAVRITPVVEQLAALDVPPDSPGAEIPAVSEVFAARGDGVEIADLVRRVHVSIAGPQR